MDLSQLPSHDAGHLRVVVETPRGSRAKLRYERDENSVGFFAYGRPLVLGVAYPFDWGFVPSTLAPDGDPLDAMVYHDVPTYPGVVIACEPVGVVKLTQRDDGEKREHNDRLIVVPAGDERLRDATSLDERTRREIEKFFELAVLMTGKQVRVEGWAGPKAAKERIDAAMHAYRKKGKGPR